MKPENQLLGRAASSSRQTQNIVNHRIAKKKAGEYLAAFIKEFNAAGLAALGGYVSKKAFVEMGFCVDATQHGDTFDGILAWYCLDPHDSSKLLLAFERDHAYAVERPYEKFDKEGADRLFKLPVELVPFQKCAPEEINNVHLDARYSIPANEVTVTGHEVADMVRAFMDRFVKMEDGTSHNAYPIAFFHKEQFEQLLNQPGAVGIRYYFGYDGHLINKIRPVLVAVGEDGRNLTGILENHEISLFLQNSWPPPPWNQIEGNYL